MERFTFTVIAERFRREFYSNVLWTARQRVCRIELCTMKNLLLTFALPVLLVGFLGLAACESKHTDKEYDPHAVVKERLAGNFNL